MDCYFGDLGWLASKSVPALCALNSSDSPLIALFSHGLKHHEYRVFYNGQVMISLWQDNKLVVCGANFGSPSAFDGIPRLGFDGSTPRPRITAADTNLLAKLSLDGLKVICQLHGLSRSGKRLDMARRIGGREGILEHKAPPPPDRRNAKKFRESLKEKSAEEMKVMCMQYGLKGSGTKDDLTRRLVSYSLRNNKEDVVEKEMRNLLLQTAVTRDDKKPTLNQAYCDGFNLVDRYNRLLSEIAFKSRQSTWQSAVLYFIVRICVVNAWVLHSHHAKLTKGHVPKKNLKKFGQELSVSIVEHFSCQ